jgi:hypothetical protein
LVHFHNREERERYMDGLEWQMEHQREQIDRTLEQTSEDSDRRRKALERLRSSLTSFPGRTPVRGAAEREMPKKTIRSDTPSGREKGPGNFLIRGHGGSARRLLERKANQ